MKPVKWKDDDEFNQNFLNRLVLKANDNKDQSKRSSNKDNFKDNQDHQQFKQNMKQSQEMFQRKLEKRKDFNKEQHQNQSFQNQWDQQQQVDFPPYPFINQQKQQIVSPKSKTIIYSQNDLPKYNQVNSIKFNEDTKYNQQNIIKFHVKPKQFNYQHNIIRLNEEPKQNLIKIQEVQENITNMNNLSLDLCSACLLPKQADHQCDEEYGLISCPYCSDHIVRNFLNDHLVDCIEYIEHQFQTLDKVEECSICMVELIKDLQTLNCSHTFHKSCIDDWKVKNNDCPCCRKPI